MNVHDSERLAGVLHEQGLAPTASPDDADIIVVNTCAVRQKAVDKVLSELGRYRKIKELRPEMLLVVAGCVSQEMGKRLLKAAPFVDIVMGPDALPRLWTNISARAGGNGPVIDTELEDSYRSEKDRVIVRGSPFQAWLPIMEGCDNYCSYCIVPYVRGRERSRPADDIIEQARALVASGVLEITLLGQNVNSYQGGSGQCIAGFPDLLRALDAVPGLRRLRFVTSHPKDLSPALIRAMADCPSVCESLHLPFQSGSNSVLERMRRGYTREQYLHLIAALRREVPGIALSADIIVGFPGETEDDFLRTLGIVEQVRFHNLFSFWYSVRKGTEAALWGNPVPLEVKRERLLRLNAMQNQISADLRQEFVGSTQEILVEDEGKRGGGVLTGRTRGHIVVNVPGPAEWIGTFVNVLIEDSTVNCLYGRAAS